MSDDSFLAGLPTAAALTDPATAINFALDRLEPFQVEEFLREHREGIDLQGWLNSVNEVHLMAQSIGGQHHVAK